MNADRKLIQPSIPIGFLTDALQAAHCRGWSVDDLLSDHELALEQTRTEVLISVERYSEVLRQLGRRYQDAFYGFLPYPLPLKAFAMNCQGLIGCRSLEEVIEHCNDFYSLFGNGLAWGWETRDSDIAITITLTNDLSVDSRFAIESLLIMTLRMMGWLVGEDIEPDGVSVTFEHAPRDDHLTYLFGKTIQHRQPQNALFIAKNYADVSLSCNRDQLKQLLRGTRHLFLVSRHRNPLSQSIRRLLLIHKDQEILSVETTAELLNSTPNRLWRQLQREGTSFLAIRDQVKRDWATALLTHPDATVEAVAEQLGYADSSAFRKAFRKWTGYSPTEHRQQ